MPPNAQTPLEELNQKLNYNLRVMKRCFMTGKPCIFSFKTSTTPPKVFTVMQFSSNLDAFFEWSLKPFLASLPLPEENIHRADKERGVGYVVCEKICRKIQESHLIIADLSFPNPNVFYEIGLACGLERPISFIRNEKSKNIMSDTCIKKTLNFLKEEDILVCPGVEPMLLSTHKKLFLDSIQNDYPKPKIQKKELKISVLSFKSNENNNAPQDNEPRFCDEKSHKEDIKIDFVKLISGAVNVALLEIRKKICERKKNKLYIESWEEVVAKKDKIEWDKFSRAEPIYANCGDISTPTGNFDNIKKIIHESFCIIIDISDNNPISYFWLGYCHAYGINVIPVNSVTGGKKAKLAFDIHALWYAEYDEKEPYKFKNIIREILEHLLGGYLSDQHRRAFWDRFPPGSSIKVFMGAIHSRDHNREVVGDWDVRAVSELFSYLPSVRSAELVTPLYSPEESWWQQYKRKPTDGEKIEFINNFCNQIKKQLMDSSAIVIASPDVNPVTEYILYHTYSVRDGDNPFIKNGNEKFEGFIAVKRVDPSKYKVKESAATDEIKFDRLFYRSEATHTGELPNRGFISHKDDDELPYRGLDRDPLFKKYLGKDEMTDEGFDLLGHLVVARNPVNSDYLVVLLNGVSGPATYALAQILVGGGIRAEPWMKSRSEELLAKINSELDRELDKEGKGIEAIVKVGISKDKNYSMTYVDTRALDDWKFLDERRYGPSPINFR